MAEADGTIIIAVELDDGTVRKVKTSADELGQSLSKGLSDKVSSGLDKSFTGIAVQVQFIAKIASAAFGTISNVVGKAVEEASQAEAAFNSLQIALGNIGADPKGANAIADLASELQRLGTVSDDAVIAASQSLVSIGGLAGAELEKATKASVDLAAGLGVDLNTAFDLVAKSAAGNTAALGRYGIKVDENISKSEKFAAALAQINQRFGGFDEARANTFAGSIQKLGISFNDIFESLGKFITQDKVVVSVIKFISQEFGNIAKSIDSAFGSSGGIIGNFIKQLISVSLVINQSVGPAFDALKNIVVVTFSAISTGVTATLAALGGLAVGVNTILNAVGLASNDALAKSKQFFEEQSAALFTSSQATAEAIKTEFSGDLPLTNAIDGLLLKLNEAAVLAPEIASQTAKGIKEPLAGAAVAVTAAVKSMSDAIIKGFATSISAGAQAAVNALIKGKNAFSAFGSAVLGVIGDVAIQIGTTLIGIGIGMEAVKSSILGLTGGPAIFAGIALVGLGTLLKALSGGGGGSAQAATSAGAGGVTGSGGSPGVETIQQPEPERRRETQVAVNIQGNILDRRESGLEIAKVLQEYFDTNDGILAKG